MIIFCGIRKNRTIVNQNVAVLQLYAMVQFCSWSNNYFYFHLTNCYNLYYHTDGNERKEKLNQGNT